MGQALRGAAGDGGAGRHPAARRLTLAARALALLAPALLAHALLAPLAPLAAAQPPPPAARVAVPPAGERAPPPDPTAVTLPRGAERLDAGRFTFVAYPADLPLARALLRDAAGRDSFPGLPRPTARALVAIAPDARRFRAWTGPSAPHWGVAVAFPALQRVVLRGGRDAAAAGDPAVVLRHELAHLALHEALGDLPPRWFDEGYASYAAGEWGRDELLTANLTLLYRRMPGLDSLDRSFRRGQGEAAGAYALAHRAVAELAALDPARGLTLFFRYWKEDGRLDPAVRRAYGITLDGFEERWQRRTRQRYGALALIGELTVGAGFALLVVLPLYVLRRRRDRRRWAELRAADARAAEAAAAAAAAGWAEAESPEEPEGERSGGAGEEPAAGDPEAAAPPSKGAQPFA
jgi:hypothetical protein